MSQKDVSYSNRSVSACLQRANGYVCTVVHAKSVCMRVCLWYVYAREGRSAQANLPASRRARAREGGECVSMSVSVSVSD